MTNQTERILDQKATLFRDGPRPVYLLPDGRFSARHGDRWVTKKTLAALDKFLQGERRALKMMHVDTGITYRDHQVAVSEIAEMTEAKHMIDRLGKRVYKGWGDEWFLYDPELHAQLEDLNRRVALAEIGFNKEMQAIRKKLKNVRDGNFKDLLAEHGS